MPKVAKLVIGGYIGEQDPWLMSMGLETTTSSGSVSKFLEENADADEIHVELRSNGGSVTHGFNIHDLLIGSGKKIVTIGYNIKSIATVIFLAGSVRKIADNAEFLIHNPWIDPFDLPWTGLEADDLQKLADDMRAEEDRLLEFYAKKLGLNDADREELKAIMDQDSSMTVTDVMEWGFATEKITESNNRKGSKAFVYSDAFLNAVKTKNTDMTKVKTDLMTVLKDEFSKLSKKLGVKSESTEVKNESTTLENGDTLYHDGALAEGVNVFTDAEMTTAASDGDYVLSDGRTVTVASGAVSAIKEADAGAEALAAIRTKNAQMAKDLKKAQEDFKSANKKATDLEKKNKELTEAFTTLNNKFEEFVKNYTPPAEDDQEEDEQDITDKSKPGVKPGRFAKLKKSLANKQRK